MLQLVSVVVHVELMALLVGAPALPDVFLVAEFKKQEQW